MLTGFTAMLFQAIGIDPEPFFERWMIPCGALGAVVIASWLVEAKQSVIENMAPVLTRLFTPMFAIVLIVYLATMTFTGRMIEFNRELLIAFDLLLVVVLGLLLYSISARDPLAPKNLFDVLSARARVGAPLVDAVALPDDASRISELGSSPTGWPRWARTSSAREPRVVGWLYVGFLRGKGPSRPSSAGRRIPAGLRDWAAFVVTVFPRCLAYI